MLGSTELFCLYRTEMVMLVFGRNTSNLSSKRQKMCFSKRLVKRKNIQLTLNAASCVVGVPYDSLSIVSLQREMKALLREGIPKTCRSEVWRR